MRKNIKSRNRVDEEELCVDCFIDYLDNKNFYKEIIKIPEPNDPPDYWLEMSGKKYAVEVTSLTKNAEYNPQCENLAKHIELEAKKKGWLCGAYSLHFMTNPEIPKENSKNFNKIVVNALDYIQRTMNLTKSEERILLRSSKGILNIAKLHNGKSYIGYLHSSAKWASEIDEDLKDIIQHAINKKTDLLAETKTHCAKIILLLYDAYLYADIKDMQQAMKNVLGIEWFHALFWIQALGNNETKGYILFTKETSWI